VPYTRTAAFEEGTLTPLFGNQTGSSASEPIGSEVNLTLFLLFLEKVNPVFHPVFSFECSVFPPLGVRHSIGLIGQTPIHVNQRVGL
jgi:hypothetical protein